MDLLSNSDFWKNLRLTGREFMKRPKDERPQVPINVLIADIIACEIVKSGARRGAPIPGARDIAAASEHATSTITAAFQRLVERDIIVMQAGRPTTVLNVENARSYLLTSARRDLEDSVRVLLLCGHREPDILDATRAAMAGAAQ